MVGVKMKPYKFFNSDSANLNKIVDFFTQQKHVILKNVLQKVVTKGTKESADTEKNVKGALNVCTNIQCKIWQLYKVKVMKTINQ